MKIQQITDNKSCTDRRGEVLGLHIWPFFS